MSAKFDKGFLYQDADLSRPAPEPRSAQGAEKYRSHFRKDYARLTHSPAFRRLQGKTQLFPGTESDFFRNRLTHSLEVAQIAKSIAIRINSEFDPFNRRTTASRDWKIDTDLVEFAGLAHDLGHPPFGHNGEAALNKCMRDHGGYEGNAQSLRIVSTLEKKRRFNPRMPPVLSNSKDNRAGLNLTYRSLAALLKYDNEIQPSGDGTEIDKGFYSSEKTLVSDIKRAVTGRNSFRGEFKTIECSIMDLADDIAYSTYDLEDSLKAGFLSILDYITLKDKSQLFQEVTRKVWNRLHGQKNQIRAGDIPRPMREEFDGLKERVGQALISTISNIFVLSGDHSNSAQAQQLKEQILDHGWEDPEVEAIWISWVYGSAERIQKDGYLRMEFTSSLVGEFIRGVQIEFNEDFPQLSRVKLDAEKLLKIEALKNYTYEAHIMSPRLKVTEFRGKDFVKSIFDDLSDHDNKGYLLLPEDWKELYLASKPNAWRYRVIADYVAGMTDRYALEFYGRLRSENPQTIYKEH